MDLPTVDELNIELPGTASGRVANYDAEAASGQYQINRLLIQDKYHYEKFIGKRRNDGADKLKELRPEHMQYVSCFINGMKGVDIAEQFDVAAITVYRVLADPLARSLIAEFDERFQEEFRAMFPLVSNAVREGLTHPSTEIRLKAVDRWAKVGRFLEGMDSDTERDNKKKTQTVVAARVQLVNLIKDASKAVDGPSIIEGEVIISETPV